MGSDPYEEGEQVSENPTPVGLPSHRDGQNLVNSHVACGQTRVILFWGKLSQFR